MANQIPLTVKAAIVIATSAEDRMENETTKEAHVVERIKREVDAQVAAAILPNQKKQNHNNRNTERTEFPQNNANQRRQDRGFANYGR